MYARHFSVSNSWNFSIRSGKILFENQIRDRAFFPIKLSESNTLRVKAKGQDLSKFTLKIIDVELFEKIRAPELFKGKLIPKTSTLNFEIPRPGPHLIILKGSQFGLLASLLSEVELNGERIDLVGNFLDFSKNWRIVKEVNLSTSNSLKVRIFGGSESLEVSFLRPIKLPGEFEPSLGSMEILNLSQNSFNNTSTQIEVRANGTTFLPEPATVSVYNNQNQLEDVEVSISGDRLYIKGALKEGINNLQIDALDANRDMLTLEGIYFSGSSELRVYAVDENVAWINDFDAQVFLQGFQLPFEVKASAQNNYAALNNIPKGTVNIVVQSPNGLGGTIADIEQPIHNHVVQVFPTPPLADNSNNEFENGLDGWVTSGDVELVPHEEETTEVANQLQNMSARSVGSDDQEVRNLDLKIYATTPTMKYVEYGKPLVPGYPMDGWLQRRIEVPDGTRMITVKVKSTTPYHSFVLAGALTLVNWAKGEDGWKYYTYQTFDSVKEYKIMVWVHRREGEPPQSVTIDSLTFTGFRIGDVELTDVNNYPLVALSASGQNPYFGGRTLLSGSIRLNWGVNDGVRDVAVEFLQKGVLRAKASLTQSGKDQIASLPANASQMRLFGSGQYYELFELNNAEAAKLNPVNGPYVSARLRVETKAGKVIIQEIEVPGRPGSLLPILVRYGRENRYPDINLNRDELLGGDDWAKRRVAIAIAGLAEASLRVGTTGFRVNDFSNMNGGFFYPHQSHRHGLSVDCKVVGFPNREQAKKGARPGRIAAQNLLALLRAARFEDIEKIGKIYVSYRKADPATNFPGDEFYRTINGQIVHGRQATSLLVADVTGGHIDHFHIEFKPNLLED